MDNANCNTCSWFEHLPGSLSRASERKPAVFNIYYCTATILFSTITKVHVPSNLFWAFVLYSWILPIICTSYPYSESALQSSFERIYEPGQQATELVIVTPMYMCNMEKKLLKYKFIQLERNMVPLPIHCNIGLAVDGIV